MKKLSVLLVVVMLAALFAACAVRRPLEVVEKKFVTQQVEKVVTQQVEVEKVVKETVQVEVTKVVEATPVPAEPSGCNVAAPEKATRRSTCSAGPSPSPRSTPKNWKRRTASRTSAVQHATAGFRFGKGTGPPGSLRQGHLALRNRPCG